MVWYRAQRSDDPRILENSYQREKCGLVIRSDDPNRDVSQLLTRIKPEFLVRQVIRAASLRHWNDNRAHEFKELIEWKTSCGSGGGRTLPEPRFVIVTRNCECPMLSTILIIILILLLIGALPTWPYSGGWGYYPGGGIGLILLIVIILALMGRI
jgi:hypothetical protein